MAYAMKEINQAYKMIERGETVNPSIVRHIVQTLRVTGNNISTQLTQTSEALHAALAEIERLGQQVTELQQANNREVERRRAAEQGEVQKHPRLPFDVVGYRDGDLRVETTAKALEEIWLEHNAAVAKHPPFNSAHEAWAVLFEEVDELWDEVKLREQNPAAMRIEARQVGAMALRFMSEMGQPGG